MIPPSQPPKGNLTKMCIYTKRLYHCWCVDYYIKFANRCTASLRSDKECPRPPYLSKCEVERVGLCPFHSHEEEAKHVTTGIPNPGYTKTEEGNSQQAGTVAKTRYSDPNPEAKSKRGTVEAESGRGSGNRGSGIRTSKTFPRSPPPAPPYRRSDPSLEGRGVPNPWMLSPQKLQRSKTSAQAPPPPPPPRPTSFQQPALQEPQPPPPPPRPTSFQQPAPQPQHVGVPNPWKLSPQKLQRSKTSAQPPHLHLPQRPTSTSFQQPLPLPLPLPLHRPNTTTTPTPTYTPILASHLQRASTYTPTSTSRPAPTAKPVQVAIRDSRGFFISPSVYQERVPSPLQYPDPNHEPELELELRQGFGREEVGQEADAQIQYSPSTPIPTDKIPILCVKRISTLSPSLSLSPSRTSISTADWERERERRKSNRVSFVCQVSDDEAGPSPLKMQREIESGNGGGKGEEVEVEVLYSGSEYDGESEDEDENNLPGERMVRGSKDFGVGVGFGGGEEMLYSGSEYDGDSEDERPAAAEHGNGNWEKGRFDGGLEGGLEGQERERGSVLFEMLYAHASQPQESVGGGKEGEVEGKEEKDGEGKGVYTDSEYETEYVDTD